MTYVNKYFFNCKIIYNNINDENTNQRRSYTPNINLGEEVIAMIYKHLYTIDNNIKVPTPINISLYLQAIQISNKPTIPFFYWRIVK